MSSGPFARPGSYDEACAAAATNQGLDPITEALTAAGITHEVEQTGGFTMVVTVNVPTGVVALTHDGEGDADYLLGYYPGTMWQDGEYDGEYDDVVLNFGHLTLTEAMDKVKAYAAGTGA